MDMTSGLILSVLLDISDINKWLLLLSILLILVIENNAVNDNFNCAVTKMEILNDIISVS